MTMVVANGNLILATNIMYCH